MGREKSIRAGEDGTIHFLEAFADRLRDLRPDHIAGDGGDRSRLGKIQAEQALSYAREVGLLSLAGESWEDFCNQNPDLHFGTEHVVESDPAGEWMAKLTKPPKFGLVPKVFERPVENLRSESDTPDVRRLIEFEGATPLDYLDRWILANQLFEDSVELIRVVQWADGSISFAVRQPQYHGEPARESDIEQFFLDGGWTRIRDPGDQHATGDQHLIFYNYAFETLAMDAAPRNCYIFNEGLLPFDVILCRPDNELERYLKLYPEIQ